MRNIEYDAHPPQNFAGSCFLQRGAQRTLMHNRSVIIEDEGDALGIPRSSAFVPRYRNVRELRAWLTDSRIEWALVRKVTHFRCIQPHSREVGVADTCDLFFIVVDDSEHTLSRDLTVGSRPQTTHYIGMRVGAVCLEPVVLPRFEGL